MMPHEGKVASREEQAMGKTPQKNKKKTFGITDWGERITDGRENHGLN